MSTIDSIAAAEQAGQILPSTAQNLRTWLGGTFLPDWARAAIEELHNGHPDKALGLLKSCQLCGKCSMVCPRGINTRHLILSIAKVYGNK